MDVLAGGFCFLVPLVITLVGLAMWIWMLIDCVTNEPSEGNDKLIWVLIIIFGNWIGALVYYFVRRPERIQKYGQ